MRFVPLRLGRVHLMILMSASLVVIVAAVLGWLGWRMSDQEAMLSRQASMLRLNFWADGLPGTFRRYVGATEDNLFQVDATKALPLVRAQWPGPLGGPPMLLVRLTDEGLEIDPPYEASDSQLTPAQSIALSQVLESLRKEWREFRQGQATTLNKRLTTIDDVPTLTLVDANPTRLVAGVYLGERAILGPWLLDLNPPGARGGRWVLSFVDVRLVDYVRRQYLGRDADAAYGELGDDFPWQFRVVERRKLDADSALALTRLVPAAQPALRRVGIVPVLILTIGVVTAGCYALARGTLREAAAARLQSDFVAAVSHEFRSPLTTMAQLTEVLADGRVSEEPRRRVYFDVLHQQTSRLHRLVEDLLAFGLVNAGRWQCQLEPLELCQFLRDCVGAFQRSSPNAPITVNCSQPSIWIDGDQDGLTRVVRNLLENAVKYSPAHTPVVVDLARSTVSVTISVRDQGMGIPAHEQKRIFEKFTRGDAAKKACIAGTGIGLAMVKELVLAHRGDVRVESAVGAGSTLVVTLPARPTPPEPQS